MPKRVSIVVFRECDPSIIYGVFDTLWAAGRFLKASPGKPRRYLLEEPAVAVWITK